MLTLAPSVTLWDSGEFLAAIQSLGIPHPPGTPLYVVLGKVWSLAFAPIFGFARSINLLSAVCTAAGCGILSSLFARWTDDGFAATAAGVTAGLMSTVWLSATETAQVDQGTDRAWLHCGDDRAAKWDIALPERHEHCTPHRF